MGGVSGRAQEGAATGAKAGEGAMPTWMTTHGAQTVR